MDNHVALGGGVGLLLCGLPVGPYTLGRRQFVPTFCFVGVVVGVHHVPFGRSNKDRVADGEVGPLCLRLVLLHKFDLVRDAFGFPLTSII